MRGIKFGVLILIILFGIYAVSMTFVDERKEYSIHSNITYPIDKVFPQFNNLQNFSHWNDFFTQDKNLGFSFFTPYSGKDSSMKFYNKKHQDQFGEMFIRYENPMKSLRYQLFLEDESYPYLIDVKFIGKGESTEINWKIQTPKQPLLRRSLNLLSETLFVENIEKSIKNLTAILGNKVDKENLIASIKYDSIMVENQESALLLGVNVSTSNKKDALLKNIVINHNKVVNYVKQDLGKKDDEFGSPILITNPNNFKDKEVSYFYGVALPKRISTSDNNYTFRTLNGGQTYFMYYKGSYAGRIKSIQQLIQKVKKDTLRHGDLQEQFLEEPDATSDVKLKLQLPVYR
ncbi:SRPBCC family protein [Chryseobacterium sp. POL2]|uniref:polyketide cyclase n=1 Tax=Chryseobacterium sp. POL2 TaxID=2713414 RepID=UPI0013E1661C|nr:polyketide cyclase [Chryseobacterium sp. POL2]QIG90719.1 polyketide cyclase [Chryseobacterium sp. POL2]